MTSPADLARDAARSRRVTPALLLAGGLATALAVAAVVGASPEDTAALVAMAGGGAAVAVGVTVALLGWSRGRSLALQLFVVAAGAIVATALGVGVAAWAMFLSAHDLGALAVVLVLSVSVGASAAWILGHRFSRSVELIGAQIDALDRDVPTPAPARPALVSAELQRLSEVLDAMHRQLTHARRRAETLESSRRELVAWVSHDLRSPIGTVRAMAEALEDGVVSAPDEVDGYHRAIRQETERLARLVDDLFELSRIEAGAPTTDVPFVPLHELVTELVDAAAARAAAQGITLRADLAGIGPELVVAAELRRAIDNVLDNAIRHTPSGGSVTATAQADGGGLVLVIGDECGGIPEQELARVFDVAFRGDVSRSRDTGGGGLGLAIARGLVEAHAGEISVRNRAEGCEFIVRAPAKALP